MESQQKSATKIQADSMQVSQFFVEKETTKVDISKADKAGKFLVFDITNFKTLDHEFLNSLSKQSKMAYIMDRRLTAKADDRVSEGKSPFSDTERQMVIDPLALAHVRNKFTVQNKEKGMKYLFPWPQQVSTLQKAGYKLVDPKGKGSMPFGDEKSGRIVVKNAKGEVDNVAMKVSQADYDKHIAYYGNESKRRLGQNVEDTKESMKRYDAKVNIYDKSKLTK